MSLEYIAESARTTVDVWANMLGFHDFSTYTCKEAESFAELARAVGHTAVADDIIREHARGDVEESDLHHDLYLQLEEP